MIEHFRRAWLYARFSEKIFVDRFPSLRITDTRLCVNGLFSEFNGRSCAAMLSRVELCKLCDRNRILNLLLHAPLGQHPADQPFAARYIDNVGGQGLLSLIALPKSILTIINGLTR